MPPPSPGSRWILDPWRDLLLFIGPPALLLPGALVADRLWNGKSLYALVMAFGALGHHLPGMMRAYGDRALWARFRTRFILAPLFLVTLCAAFALRDPTLAPIVLITYCWGVWHGLMQTHGFLRIYDAKVHSFSAATVRLDQWMCLVWFGAGVVFSTTRLHHILQKFYASGGPPIPLSWIHDLRLIWGAITVVVTLAFLANMLRESRAGRAPSPVKLALLGSTLVFWWYTNAVVANLLVGIALFEIFHDVQYLAIVWIYNRKRVEIDPQIGDFTRFLFRGRRALILLYIGLVFAYGSLSLLPKLPSMTINTLFTAVLAASTLLHFYYDSFIWKMREKPMRATLGLEGGQDVQLRGTTGWAMPGWRWAALAVPAVCLALTSARPRMSQDETMQQLGLTFPNYPLAQNNLAVFLLSVGDADEAIAVSRRVLVMRPRDPDLVAKARTNLFWGLVGEGVQQLQYGRPAAAEPLLREAAHLDPAAMHFLGDEAMRLAMGSDHAHAIAYYRAALILSPNDAQLHLGLARELFAHLSLEDAIEHARMACGLRPNDRASQRFLATLEAARGAGG